MTFPRPNHVRAMLLAEEFRSLFPPESFVLWQFAGGIRRGDRATDEIVHVVIPLLDTQAVFDQQLRVMGLHTPANPVWLQLDQFVAAGRVQMQYDARTGFCWHQHRRAVVYEGVPHCLMMTSRSNWGLALISGTGPPEFVSRVWERLESRGCPVRPGLVAACGANKARFASEEDVFELAGMKFVGARER